MEYTMNELIEYILKDLSRSDRTYNIKKLVMLFTNKTTGQRQVDFFDYDGIYQSVFIDVNLPGFNETKTIVFEHDFSNNEQMKLYDVKNQRNVWLPILSIYEFPEVKQTSLYYVYVYNNNTDLKATMLIDENNNIIESSTFNLRVGYNIIGTSYIKKDNSNMNIDIIKEMYD